MCTSTARNWPGVSSSTAFVGSPTSSVGSRRRAASGLSRGSATRAQPPGDPVMMLPAAESASAARRSAIAIRQIQAE